MTSTYIDAKDNPSRPVPYRLRLDRHHDPRYYPALLYGYLLIALVYVVWRTAMVDWTVWFGPVSWLTDLFGVATTGLFLSIMWRHDRPAPRPVRLVTRTVDILIPTLNEPLSVLEPTVIGALKVRGARRVLVLDDGDRPEVREMARRRGAGYLSRVDRAGAKAGNLNHGLRHSDAELVALLDADHIPVPELLEATVGYFDDPRLGFVQTPQSFYNTESLTFRRRHHGNRGTWHEQEMFYGGVQPAKNRTNSAFFTGTCAVLRRSALDSVGGFATGTATEDIHTSIRLHAKGWLSAYLPTPLAYGLEVDNLREFHRTRRRWAAGSLGLLRSADSPLRIRGLTLAQRLNYLSATLAHLQGGYRLVLFAIPILTVATARPPVHGSYPLFGALSMGFIAFSLYVTQRYGRGHFHPLYNEVFNVAVAVPMVAGLRGLLRTEKKFGVTAKRASRRGGIQIKLVYWTIAAASGLGLARAGQLAASGQHLAVAGWSAAFLAVNTAVLLTFLIGLERYERWPAAPVHARLAPSKLYAYVVGEVHTGGRPPARLNKPAPWTEVNTHRDAPASDAVNSICSEPQRSHRGFL